MDNGNNPNDEIPKASYSIEPMMITTTDQGLAAWARSRAGFEASAAELRIGNRLLKFDVRFVAVTPPSHGPGTASMVLRFNKIEARGSLGHLFERIKLRAMEEAAMVQEHPEDNGDQRNGHWEDL
jgi:hypothetical protein